jgi:hypothetical protein
MTRLAAVLILFSPLMAMTKVIDNLDNERVEWLPFSDQVMGGISEINFSEKDEEKMSFYHMEGNVSTENNGGFIQFRAAVNIDDLPYEGLRIMTRGNGEEYFIHVRTPKTRLPWNYYAASFNTTNDWQYIEIPFDSFKKSGLILPQKFKASDIKSIGIVAFGKDFYADIDLASIELY